MAGDGLERLDGDGDLDHATPRLIGTTWSAISPRCRACSSDSHNLVLGRGAITVTLESVDDLPLLRVQALIWLRRHGRA